MQKNCVQKVNKDLVSVELEQMFPHQKWIKTDLLNL